MTHCVCVCVCLVFQSLDPEIDAQIKARYRDKFKLDSDNRPPAPQQMVSSDQQCVLLSSLLVGLKIHKIHQHLTINKTQIRNNSEK